MERLRIQDTALDLGASPSNGECARASPKAFIGGGVEGDVFVKSGDYGLKTITIPTSAEAMERLDVDTSIDGDLVEIALTDEEFYSLYRTPVFDSLNSGLQILIDDFEDESIVGVERLKTALALVQRHNRDLNHPQILKLEQVIEHAIRFETGVFFFF